MTDQELLNVEMVAKCLGCSPRTVYRLADGGGMPFGVKVGALRRWRRMEIEQWIDAGCHRVEKGMKP